MHLQFDVCVGGILQIELKKMKLFAFSLTPPAMELFCCVLRGRALRWLFSSLFLFFKSEGVFVVLRKGTLQFTVL